MHSLLWLNTVLQPGSEKLSSRERKSWCCLEDSLLGVHRSIYCALAMAGMLYMHLEEAGAASPLPPSFSVSLKKNKTGIKERKKYVVHKIEITYPETQRQPTTSW